MIKTFKRQSWITVCVCVCVLSVCVYVLGRVSLTSYDILGN